MTELSPFGLSLPTTSPFLPPSSPPDVDIILRDRPSVNRVVEKTGTLFSSIY